MSTRSLICKELPDGNYFGIYCHWDGYLTNNGAILLDHYSDSKKLDMLFELGDISSLRKKINPDPALPHDFENCQDDVTVAYHRDRGEEIHKARVISLDDAKNSWCEYMYVYSRDGKWRYFNLCENESELRDVEADLNAEFEGMGIRRPFGEYGYFSPSEIARIKVEQMRKSESAPPCM